jgi:hypothetical protein
MQRPSGQKRAAMCQHGGEARDNGAPPSSLKPQDSRNRSRTQGKPQPVHDHTGRVVGTVSDGVLRKRVKGRRHQLQRPPAWALDVTSIEEAASKGARAIRIEDTESGREYSANLDLFRQRAFRFNRGYGDQLALPLEYWHENSAGSLQPMLL